MWQTRDLVRAAGIACVLVSMGLPVLAAEKKTSSSSGTSKPAAKAPAAAGGGGAGATGKNAAAVDQVPTVLPPDPAPVSEAEKASAEADEVAAKGYWDIVSKAVGVTDAQRPAWNKAVAARIDALKKFDAEHAQTASASEGKGKKKGNEERDALEEKGRQGILAVLTDEQKAKFEGFRLYMSSATHYAKAALTKEQKEKLRSLCQAEGKTALEVWPDQTKYKALKQAIYTKADAEILTEDQRATIKTKKAGKAAEKAEKAAGSAQ